MTQTQALQLLFDLRYLIMVLTAKGDEARSGRSKQDSRYLGVRLVLQSAPKSPFLGLAHLCV